MQFTLPFMILTNVILFFPSLFITFSLAIHNSHLLCCEHGPCIALLEWSGRRMVWVDRPHSRLVIEGPKGVHSHRLALQCSCAI